MGNRSFQCVMILLCAIEICFCPVDNFAQAPKKIKQIQAKNIESVSVDRLGELFLVFKNGVIKKYDTNGNVLASLKKGKTPSLIEPWFHPLIFAYYRNQQQYIFYDHNLGFLRSDKVDPSVAVSPFLACPTNDNKLLVLDKGDWSIKKINPANNKVLSEFNIDTTSVRKPEFSYLREYQNLIFLLDKSSGIFIFSILGKRINHIKCKVQNFGFYGEELFYLSGDKVIFYDLYSENTREVKVEPGKFVIVTDERIFLIKENSSVAIYEFRERPEDEEPKK